MTVMAEKLKAAGVERDVLYLGAVEALRRSGGNIDRAVAIFREVVVSTARDMNIKQEPQSAPCPVADIAQRRAKREASRQLVQQQARDFASRIRALYSDRLISGRLIHRMQLLEIDEHCASNDREAAFLRALKHRVRANDSSVTIGDTISPDKYDELRAEFYGRVDS